MIKIKRISLCLLAVIFLWVFSFNVLDRHNDTNIRSVRTDQQFLIYDCDFYYLGFHFDRSYIVPNSNLPSYAITLLRYPGLEEADFGECDAFWQAVRDKEREEGLLEYKERIKTQSSKM
jgi:hypothetical protein